jgi:hypothetical protein
VTLNQKFNSNKWLATIMAGSSHVVFPETDEEWKDLLQYAKRHRVTALCYHHLVENSIHDRCSKDFVAELKQQTLHRAATEMAQALETQHLLSALDQEGIQPILLKGKALAYTLYPKPYLREHCDTDLLIRVKDIEKVFQLLEEKDYQYHRVDDLLTRQISFSKNGAANVPNVLDVHWRISNRPLFQDTLTYVELREHSVNVPELGENAITPNPVYSLLFACMHRGAEGTIGANESLLWLYDIHLMLNAMTEAELALFIKLAREKQICAICENAIVSSCNWFHSAVPAWVHNELQAQKTPEPTERLLIAGAPRYQPRDLISVKGFRKKLGRIREAIFPPAAYLLRNEGSERRALLPALYFQRVLQSLRSTQK